ncbi:ADP-ribosylglycohydrolase family protein [Treponema sp. HNW]|uniref:ADP-ribosylglycohydrolase family protein n=1 Tax=Treponema sp. HNW TaxID=3116654 RepID=UPI003D132630
MKDIKWLTFSESVVVEYEQSKDEGRLVDSYQAEVSFIKEKYQRGILMEQEAAALFKKIQSAPVSDDYIYQEPSDIETIKKLCVNTTEKKLIPQIDKEVLRQKIHGAWLGRCAGCLLGQPVEGWYRSRITGFLHDTNNFLPRAYFASNVSDTIRKKYNITDAGHVYGSTFINWINNVKCAPEDDDTNYTIIGLKTLEENGKDFTSLDIAHSWLMNMQFLHACTAERVAYRNFVNLIEPPYSASYNNAYREWIGAQIRADIFGYVSPGDIEAAAALAWKDACISHTKNGIYGEMFIAAMIAKAAVCNDMGLIIEAGLSQIPATSRLYAAIRQVIEWKQEEISWETAFDRIHALYDETNPHHWCHTISNAMICVISLLWGALNFEKTIGLSVVPGFDTDCNAATTGSIIGMLLGAHNLPRHWIDPLNDTLKSGIDGFNTMRISELAERSLNIALK